MQDFTVFLSHHPYLSTAFIVVLVIVFLLEWIRARRNVFNLTSARVTHLLNRENAVVIDIRAQDAYKSGHILNSHCMKPDEIKQNPKKLEKFRGNPIIIVAAGGNEAQKLAAFLLKNGYNAYSLAGGIPAWIEAQLPLVKR